MPIDTDNPFPDWRPNPLVGESDMEGDKGVDPDDNAPGGEQQIFRPHPFALGFGNNGAKIAFGNFLYRYDVIEIGFTDAGSGVSNSLPSPSGSNIIAGAAAQSPTVGNIKGLYSRIPKAQAPDGDPLKSKPAANTFSELGAYGDVYLYWTVDTDGPAAGTDADFVSHCWVQVGNVAAGPVALGEMAGLSLDNTVADRLENSPNGTANLVSYQIKIGTVPDPAAGGEDITQELASDVYWSPTILIRTSY